MLVRMSLIQKTRREDTLVKRAATGIPGLDEIIQGGLPRGSITLLSGPPGGGKTIACFQFLYEGMQNNERCLFLTVDKKIEGLLTQAKALGIDFQPGIESGTIKFVYLNINKKLIYESMINEILSSNYDRIVLDSISPLSEMPIYINNLETSDNTNAGNFEDYPNDQDIPTRRLHLHYIMNALETVNCTSVVTSELPVGSTRLSRDGLSEFLAYGVIVLGLDPTMDRRKISVLKMRNTKHTLKPQDMAISDVGLRII